MSAADDFKVWRAQPEILAATWASNAADLQLAYEAGRASAVSEGWVLVPKEPTDTMLVEVDEEVGGHCYSCTAWPASWDDCRRVYAALLAAAPAP